MTQTHSSREMVWSRPLQVRDVQTQGNVHRVTAKDGTIVDLYSMQAPRPDARLTLELRPSDDKAIKPDANTVYVCLLYTSPSPRDLSTSRMPSSA